MGNTIVKVGSCQPISIEKIKKLAEYNKKEYLRLKEKEIIGIVPEYGYDVTVNHNDFELIGEFL